MSIPLAAGQAAGFSVAIRPEIEGNAGVHAGHAVLVSGSAAHAPAGRIERARLVGLEAGGGTTVQEVDEFTLNRASGSRPYLRNDNGRLEGRLVLDCRFFRPGFGVCPPHDHVHSVLLEVTIAGQTAASATLLVDYTPPVIRRYDLVAPDRIVVVFSEAVRHPNGDSALDWVITDPARTVVGVDPAAPQDCLGQDTRPAPSGCTRTLRLSTPVGEDATPFVRYRPGLDRVGYQDLTSNVIDRSSSTAADSSALDRVRPPLPNIEAVNGKTPGGQPPAVLGSNREPRVTLGNLAAGHEAFVVVTAPGGARFETAPVVAGSDGTVTVTLPALERAGTYRLQAVARDENGNVSTDTSKSAARPNAEPNVVSYELDVTPPLLLSAQRRSVREIGVVFSEPLLPEGHAGEWLVNGTPVQARGGASGDERVLVADQDLPQDNTVSWRPVGDSTYRDAAGNLLRALDGVEVVPLPPVPVPAVTVPASEVFTRQASQVVAGTVAAGARAPHLVVDLYDGQTDNRRGNPAPVQNDRWSAEVGLPGDGRYQLTAAARDTSTGLRSQRVAVADIVRDTVAPSVRVSSPGKGEVQVVDGRLDDRQRVGVGAGVTVAWTASDVAAGDGNRDHSRSAKVELVYSAGGVKLVADGVTPGHGQEQQVSYQVTEEDVAAAGESGEATFRVSVDDFAGNVGSAMSHPVVIDAGIIGYQPVFVQNRPEQSVVEARFAVPVEGTTLPADWRIDGLPPRAATKVSSTVVRLEASQPIEDPNATPTVVYQPSTATGVRLRASDGREVASGAFVSKDGIRPLLRITTPGRGPVNAERLQLTGQTDRSARPNTIAVYRVASDGTRSADPAATARANPDGTFTLAVPLTRNAASRFAVQAIDPGLNTSPAPLPEFSVIEDSLPPFVALLAPAANAPVGPKVAIRWQSADAHPGWVDLEYRRNGGEFQSIARGEPDDGAYEWTLPEQVVDRDVIDLRVRVLDQANNATTVTQPGLLVDLVAPLLLGAKSTGERTVQVIWSEPVVMDAGAGSFSLPGGGPPVEAATVSGDTVTLRLGGELTTTEPEVAYSGKGVADRAGNAASDAAQVTAARGFAFAVTGLVAAVDAEGELVRLSWVDRRNRAEHIAGYEVHRDGALVARTAGADKHYAEAIGEGEDERELRYSVIAVDDLGHRSQPASTTVRLGDAVREGNVGPDGGVIISDDGQVVVTVPPRAVSKWYYGFLDRLDVVPVAPGYRPLTGVYGLRLEAVDDGAGLEAFARFAEMSFRPAQGLGEATPARVSVLRRVDGVDEMATTTADDSAQAYLLAVGSFLLGEADGVTVRVSGTDPALARDRFATAAAFSQLSYARAETAVLARADDYPDALAAAALARSLHAPILLAQVDGIPDATRLELTRLGVTRVVLVGGPAALSEQVADDARALGLGVERVAGQTRFHTATAIAADLDGGSERAYLATGRNFADALAASAGSAALGRPIFLTEPHALPDVTLRGLREHGVTSVDLLGGPAAISDDVEQQLRAHGFEVRRIAGRDRYQTAVALAQELTREGLSFARPIAASGQGDGKTSPDALAAGPVAAMFGSPLLLVPRDSLHPAVAELLRDAEDVHGVVVAGGPAAISPQTRAAIDATRR